MGPPSAVPHRLVGHVLTTRASRKARAEPAGLALLALQILSATALQGPTTSRTPRSRSARSPGCMPAPFTPRRRGQRQRLAPLRPGLYNLTPPTRARRQCSQERGRGACQVKVGAAPSKAARFGREVVVLRGPAPRQASRGGGGAQNAARVPSAPLSIVAQRTPKIARFSRGRHRSACS